MLKKTVAKHNHRIRGVSMLICILSGYAYILIFANYEVTFSLCPIKQLTGFPCPGCGMGRSTFELLHGHLWTAFQWHPLGPVFHLFIIIAELWLIRDILNNRNSFYRLLKQRWPNTILFPFLGILLIIWIRNILHGH
ncbi:MAG: DUF2752 domain-containing protein [Marinilabiliaceae bacterium]|nr:DUF2752 domain-containing protein [Marinilabiliaceae bacterium]